jgi:Cu/Ag efflux pump CusA
MTRGIIAASLEYRYLVVFIALLLMIIGLLQLRSMPFDPFP